MSVQIHKHYRLVHGNHSAESDEIGWDNVAFGPPFAKTMASAIHKDGRWEDSILSDYQSPPEGSVDGDYGQRVFEGECIFPNSSVTHARLWCARWHAERFNKSARRLKMPEFPEDRCVEVIAALAQANKEYLRHGPLYVRPTIRNWWPEMRLKPSERYLFVAFAMPFGTYYTDPLRLTIDPTKLRAMPGHMGDIKSLSYAACYAHDKQLYLHPMRGSVQETDSANAWFIVSGKRELVTPPLDGTILPGNTRRMTFRLAEKLGWGVTERHIYPDEVMDKDRIRMAFLSGTAARYTRVREIERIFRLHDWWEPGNEGIETRERQSVVYDDTEAIQFVDELRRLLLDAQFGRVTEFDDVVVSVPL